jgi:high-affinity nickel permease
MLSVVVLGLLLGMRHATDADHVVAVATIVSRQRDLRLAAWVGALWGLGHTVTIVLVGAPIVLFNWVVAPRVALAMEFAVGVMLVLLGLRNLGTTSAGDVAHGHPHVRPIAVGIVHGLAGSAAVALLVLTTIRDPSWAIAYLLVFGLGTVIGMVLVTTAIALPFAVAGNGSPRTHSYLRMTTGLLSFGFGLFIAYRIGIVDGLF